MESTSWGEVVDTNIRRDKCAKCGNTFLTTVRTKKYCHEKCRKSAESARWRARLKDPHA